MCSIPEYLLLLVDVLWHKCERGRVEEKKSIFPSCCLLIFHILKAVTGLLMEFIRLFEVIICCYKSAASVFLCAFSVIPHLRGKKSLLLLQQLLGAAHTLTYTHTHTCLFGQMVDRALFCLCVFWIVCRRSAVLSPLVVVLTRDGTLTLGTFWFH